MTDRLYGTDEAAANWVKLFEELSDLPWNGHTELHKTNRGNSYKSVDEEGNRKFPPVYHIEFVPLHWVNAVSEEELHTLFAIALHHSAQIKLEGRSEQHRAHFVVIFRHR